MISPRFVMCLGAAVMIAFAAGCGKNAGQPETPAGQVTPEPAAQAQATEEVVNRVLGRVKGLIAQKNFNEAREALKPIENLQMTPELKQRVDAVKAQLPPN